MSMYLNLYRNIHIPYPNTIQTMHSQPILRSHVFSKFLVLLILSTFFSATTTTQTISAAEGEKCPLTNEDGIVQHIEQMVKEETESSKVPKDLFTGAHQGWHAKMPHLINALLEKLLWSWTSNPKKTADLKEQFNTMVKEILAKIGLYGAEEMPVKNATAHILEEIKTKYLVPMAGKINPDWAKKVSQLGNRSVPPPAHGHQQMEGEETNPNEPQNATEGEQKEEEPGAGFQTELLNYAYGSVEGLLADIKSGEVDKETKRECAKPWKERLAFVNSIAGKQLGALKAKVLAMMKAFWVRTKYGGLVMAFAKLPAFLREKNSSTWGWVAKCVGKVRGGGAESVREKANKHLAESEQNHTAPAAVVLGGSAGQSSAVDFLHRAKRARPSPGSRSSHTTYFIFVSGHNPPVFGHQFKYGTSLAIGLAYYTGWLVYVGFVGFVSVALWVDSEDSACQRTSAWLFSIFSILSSIFLLFLPFLDIY